VAIDDLATRFGANIVRIQIVPQEGLALYPALVKKEAEIRKKGLGTFIVRRPRCGTYPNGATRPIAAG
jgi:hypothetical protein